MQQEHSNKPEAADESVDDARRKFLETAGSLAAYTPPVILALMYPDLEAVASGGRNPGNGNVRPCRKTDRKGNGPSLCP